MSDIVARLVDQFRLSLCVECGKCVAVCPMGEIFDDFSYEVSPRGVIERALLDLDVLDHVGIWFCLTCDMCTNLCPAGVQFRDFIEAVRQLAIDTGVTEHGYFCRGCGAYLWPQHTLEYLKEMLGEAAEELLTLCPRCRQYDLGEKMRALTPRERKVVSTGSTDGR
jgi:ferredoxin